MLRINKNIGKVLEPIILSISLCFFLIFCSFQDGKWELIIPLGVVSSLVLYTKEDKSLKSIRLKDWSVLLVLVVLLIGIISGITNRELFHTDTLVSKIGLPSTRESFAVIMICMALLSLPWLMYLISWLREDVSKGLLENVHQVISGKVFFLICVLFSCTVVAEMIYFTNSYAIMCDDALTLSMIEHRYDELITITSKDLHPPLYYLILKFTVDCLNGSLINIFTAAKLSTVISRVFLILICVTWVRKHWGYYVAGLSSVVVCCMPSLLEYSEIIRMYGGWSALFVTCCYIQAYRTIRKNTIGNWLVLALSGLLAAYTHYWAGVMVFFVYLYMGVWSLRKNKTSFKCWCVAVIVSIIGYLPWLFVFFRQLNGVIAGKRYTDSLNLNNIIYMVTQHCRTVLLVFIIATCIILLTIKVIKTKDNRVNLSYSLLGVGLPAMIIVCGLLMSPFGTFAIIDRYLVPSLACMWIGVCIGLFLTENVRLKIISALVVLCLSFNYVFSFVCRENTNAIDTKRFMSFFQNPSTVLITSHLDHLFTLCQLVPYPLYSYDTSVSIYKWAVNVNHGRHINDIENDSQIRTLVQEGKFVYFILEKESEAKLLEEKTGLLFEKIGEFDMRSYFWNVYHVGIPDAMIE